jgi:hypothetical protein
MITKLNEAVSEPTADIRRNIGDIIEIKKIELTFKTFPKEHIGSEPLDDGQKKIVNSIGDLIKDVADVIYPDGNDELYNICKKGVDIENRILNYCNNYKQNLDTISDNMSDGVVSAKIINNGSKHFESELQGDKNLRDYCIYTNACRVDAGSHKCDIKEDGSIHLNITSNDSTSTGTSDYIYISLKKDDTNDNNFNVNFKFKLAEFSGIHTYIDNTITLQKVYMEVLKLFLERIKNGDFKWPKFKGDSNDKKFISNFIATYSIKTLGDFLQEVNAGIKGGGYENKPDYSSSSSIQPDSSSSSIQPEKINDIDTDVDRIYMVNDRLSYGRFLAIKKLFPNDKINEKSYAILDTSNDENVKTEISRVLNNYGIPKLKN